MTMTREQALMVVAMARTLAEADQSLPAATAMTLVQAAEVLAEPFPPQDRAPVPPPVETATVTTVVRQGGTRPVGCASTALNRAVQQQQAAVQQAMASAHAGVQQRMAGVERGTVRARRRQALTEMVFGYWAMTYSKPSTVRLSPDRARVIARALEQNDDNLSEILFALDGARKDDWIMGRDARSSTKYDTPETILRDRGTIERHASRISAYTRSEDHPQARELLTVLDLQHPMPALPVPPAEPQRVVWGDVAEASAPLVPAELGL